VAAPDTTRRRRDDRAATVSWVEAGELRVRTAAVGSGDAVVLVHGYGVSGTYMLPLAHALAARGLSAYVPDLPGRRAGGRSREKYGIADFAGALHLWLDGVGFARPAFVANSMGCQIVTQLAARSPERVGPMVLVGPTVDPARRTGRRQLFGALRDSAHEPLSLVSLAVRETGVDIGTLLATARSALADRMEERLPLIEQETAVVYGDADGFLGLEWAQRVADLLPNGRLVVIPGEAHAVHYTRPRLVAEITCDLLAEQEPDAWGIAAAR
jgi:pimeloyl-ACP methyl ester carboxylesterase